MGGDEEGVFREEENYTEGNIRMNTHKEEHAGRKWRQITRDKDHWWRSYPPK